MPNRCILLLTLALVPLSSSFQSTSFISNLPSPQTSHYQHTLRPSKPSFLLPPDADKSPDAPSLKARCSNMERSSHVSFVRLQMSSDDTEKDINNIITIEYCTGCRWMARATWMTQELLTTFQDELDEVCLIPSRPSSSRNPHGGKFAVTLNGKVMWDRELEGRFPEMKELKRLVRDVVSPDRDLGHSDVHKEEEDNTDSLSEDASSSLGDEKKSDSHGSVEKPAPHASITYCTGCRWMLRSAWVAQELLTTFDEELNSISLLPSRPPQPGGMFTVMLDEEVLWDRKHEGRFPEPKEVKQRVRDLLCPSRDLGHSDVTKKENEPEVDEMDDDEAAEMRKFFGVS